MESEKLSIITVCYNSAKTIEETIRSILNQSSQHYEYIIIDGGSSDGTIDIIRKYHEYIDFFLSEPDYGIYDAMNKGIRVAKGNIIAFLNSDDRYFENTVDIVLRAFKKGDFDIICGEEIYIWDDNFSYLRKIALNDKLFYQMTVYQPAMFARAEVFQQIGTFDLQYKIAADYDWVLRAYVHGIRFHLLHQPLTYFRHGGLSNHEDSLLLNIEESNHISHKLLPASKREQLPRIEKAYEDARRDIRVKEFIYRNQSFSVNLLSEYITPKETVYIWGVGYMGFNCLAWLSLMDVNIKALVDADQAKWEQKILGIPITSTEILKKDKYKVIVTPKEYEAEIEQKLEDWGYRKNRDYVLFSDMLRLITTESGRENNV